MKKKDIIEAVEHCLRTSSCDTCKAFNAEAKKGSVCKFRTPEIVIPVNYWTYSIGGVYQHSEAETLEYYLKKFGGELGL